MAAKGDFAEKSQLYKPVGLVLAATELSPFKGTNVGVIIEDGIPKYLSAWGRSPYNRTGNEKRKNTAKATPPWTKHQAISCFEKSVPELITNLISTAAVTHRKYCL